MKENKYNEDGEELKELLVHYNNLKGGRQHKFLDEEAFEKIIDYFDEKEEVNKAMEAAEIGAERYPYSSSILIRKADLLIATQKYQAALQLLNHAATLDGGNIDIYILKTSAYLALDQQQKAVEILEKALAIFEGSERVDLLFELADVCDDYEEFEKVFDCLQLILQEEPNNEEALYKICFWTDFTGRNEESIRLHKKIIDEFPYNALAWFNMAAAYQGIKLYEKAIDAYHYAVTIDEKFDFAYRNMGDAYIRLRKYKEAIEVLEKVLELSKPECLIYEAIGHCYDKLKNNAQARFYYRKATHLNPDDSKLYYKISCTYFNEGQWGSASKQLETALKIRIQHPGYNLLMGECKMQLLDFNGATQYFLAAVRSRPKNINGWDALLKCLYKANAIEDALNYVAIALKHTTDNPLFIYYYSMLLFASGNSKEAILQLEKAMQKKSNLLKKFVSLNPAILQNHQVVDVISKHKRL